MTTDMIAKINDMLDELIYDYEHIGIRVQDEPFTLGPIGHLSHVWEDGEDTCEELDGICAVKVGFPGWENIVGQYFGEHIAIVAGNEASYGEDAGEIIISDATVIDILA